MLLKFETDWVQFPPLSSIQSKTPYSFMSALSLQRTCQMLGPKTRAVLKKLLSLTGFVLFLAAVWVVSREIGRVGWWALKRDFAAMNRLNLGAALILTCAAYLLLTTYDVLAF